MLALVMCLGTLTACGGSKTPDASAGTSAGTSVKQGTDTTAKGAVYYLNFKPEQDEQWQDLAAKYTKETGVPVTVITAADGTYESTLTSEMAKSEAPTLFQVNGPVGLANWKNYCYDLSKSDVYGQLTSDDFALKGDNGEVYGIAYVIETYGLIVNTKLLKEAGYTTADITNFDSLKSVAEDITARKGELGFSAFTSAGMDASSDWRFKTHLANLPIYYEYKERGISQTDAIEGTYLDNYKNVWDLYINNATCEPSLLSSKTGDDAQAEFCTSEAVFYQNGTWAWDENMESGVGADNLDMLPIYIGVKGEENQGLCTGSENYWCVNKNASKEDIQATLDFMNWAVTSDEGTTALADDMGFVCPFKDAKEPSNPLVTIANKYMEKGLTPVSWNFSSIPSENWKNGVGSALTEYAQGTASWDNVVKAFVDGWATEYKAAAKS